MSLSVSNLVRVTVSLSPQAAAARSFGVLMIAGDSDVISGLERYRTYSGIDGIALDFGVTAPEYQAAARYFGQTPKPRTAMVGRWLRTASAAQNIGGILSLSQQILAAWTVIASGGFTVVIDGSSHALTGLNFTAVTNLNGVATAITTALSGAGTCTWNGTQFVITSITTGAGVKATGTVTLSTNPNNLDTLTLNSTVITFVSGTPSGSQVKIGGSKEATSANLQAFLNATVVAGLLTADYATALNILTITYKTVGTTGNSYSLAESTSGARIVVSAATLAGGVVPSSVGYATSPASGTDISAQLKLTSSTDIALVPGYDAETPVACAAALAVKTPAWYGLMFQASTQPTDDQSIAVSDFIEALDLKRIYGVTITDSNVLSALVTTDLATRMSAGGYRQSFCQYSQNAYAIASFFGRAFTVDFTAGNTTITLMFKQEPGVTAEDLDSNQAATLQTKRCNVFVDYDNDTTILQYGVMSGPVYFDETHGLDWLQNALQTAAYNVLYTSGKVPQTDAGVNKITNAIDGVCGQAVTNGLVAPGVWNADGFGELNTGDFLKTGYYIYATPIALQSQADREAREAPPIQIAIKLAGAIQSIDMLVDVNR
jgi:hypothetical protein